MLYEAANAFRAAAGSETPDGQRVSVSVGYDHHLLDAGRREFDSEMFEGTGGLLSRKAAPDGELSCAHDPQIRPEKVSQLLASADV